MSIIGSNLIAGASGQADGAYEIERSLRFNDGDTAYLSRTPSSAGNRKTWTWSGWVKRSFLAGTTRQDLFSAGTGGSDTASFELQFGGSGADEIRIIGWSTIYLRTTQVFRDISAWYHIVVAFDSTQATSSNRLKLYINGSEVTAFTTDNRSSITLNGNFSVNNAHIHTIGRAGYSAAFYHDGYMAEVNFVDGTALDASDFGETDEDTGAWIPKQYTGSYGTNGFYLNFSDNSSVSALGTDTSGNGNNWTPNNFSVTAGADNDSLEDTPTNNWCTLNPLDQITGRSDLSNGNLDISTGSATNGQARSTLALPSSGRYYFEATITTGTSASNQINVGLLGQTSANTGSFVFGMYSLTFDTGRRTVINGALSSRAGTAASASDVVQVAVDMSTGNGWVGQNDTWYDSSNGTTGNPATGVNPTFTGLSSLVLCGFGWTYNNGLDFNFGQRAFDYTPPAGYKALNTANLPEPTIKDGTDYFNTVLYTGNGSSGQDITTVGFQPDFVWLKKRSGGTARSHQLYDSVRGAGVYLHTDFTDAENTFTDSLDAFLSNGFSLAGGNDGANGSTYPYVAWNWLAGGSSSSNTDGDITSTVSANVDAGFSIVTYTGNATASQTIGHGLQAVPSMIIVKRRNGTAYWAVNHKAVGQGSGTNKPYGYLNVTSAFNTTGPGDIFDTNANANTDSVFYVGNNSFSNASGGTYIAYCFAEVEGYSKFGTYTGNGSSDGPFVHCGFKPAIIWTKRVDGTSNWYEFDNKRNPFNLTDNRIELNSNAAEYDGYNNNHDLLSNGFKLRSSDAGSNGSGGTYMFAAWAVNPFKYSNAR